MNKIKIVYKIVVKKKGKYYPIVKFRSLGGYHDDKLKNYKIGKTYLKRRYDKCDYRICGSGYHLFATIRYVKIFLNHIFEYLIDYPLVILECSINENDIVAKSNTNGKCRVRKFKILRVSKLKLTQNRRKKWTIS